MDRLRDGRDDFVKAGDWRVWRDDEPRAGELNMALDEALLSAAAAMGVPLLRLYRWSRPTVSFGYFDRLAAVQARFPDSAWVRRWTGGGAVDHRVDVTFALAAPRSHRLAQIRPVESYRLVHQWVAAAVEELGLRPHLAGPTSRVPGTDVAPCFVAPVCADLLLDGQKIAGGAQRRTREGMLHQGSIQGEFLAGREASLRDLLTRVGRGWKPERSVWSMAEAAAQSRYACTSWLYLR